MQDPVLNAVVTFNYNNRMLPTSVSGTDTHAQSIAYDFANRTPALLKIIRPMCNKHLEKRIDLRHSLRSAVQVFTNFSH